MKRRKRRAKLLVRRPPPVAPSPPSPPPEKPFVFLLFGVVIASAGAAVILFNLVGITFGLIRPAQPPTPLRLLGLAGFAVMSTWMAYLYGRAVAERVRRWR